MPTPRTFRTLAASLSLLVGFAWTASASEVVRRGTLVFGDAACDDTEPEVATQPDGTFLTVWQRCAPSRIAAQRFDPIGRRLGDQIDLGEGVLPQVAALPDRGYAIAYLQELIPDNQIYGVYARRLAPTGSPLAEGVRIDQLGEGYQVTYAVPRIAAAKDGRLFVAWRNLFISPFPLPLIDLAVFGRMLQADLVPLGTTFEIGRSGFVDDLEVSFDEAGRAIAVTALGGVVSRRFDELGVIAGGGEDISGGGIEVFNPRVAPRPGGGWWLVWEEVVGPQVATHVFLRALDSDGRTAGPRIDIGLLGSVETTWPAVGVDPDGLVLVAARDRIGTIQQRLYDASGAPLSDLATLAPLDPFVVGRPAVAESSASGFIALWQGGARNGPTPGQLTGWDLRGALLASSCPNPNAVCAKVGSAQAEVQVRWKLGALSGFGHGLRIGQRLLFTLEHPERFDVAVNLRGGAIDWSAATSAEVEITWTEGGITRVATKPRGPFNSGRLTLPTPPPVAAAAGADLASLADLPTDNASGTCSPSTTTACLFGGRFRVAAANVPVAGGPHRPAEVLAFSDKQTLLSFAGGDGALLTLIDGQAINGKIWVHWGGLSESAFQIIVTDTTTGIARTYTNPAGKRQSRADRLAF